MDSPAMLPWQPLSVASRQPLKELLYNWLNSVLRWLSMSTPGHADLSLSNSVADLSLCNSAPGGRSNMSILSSLCCHRLLWAAGLKVTPSCRSSSSIRRRVLKMSTDRRRDGSTRLVGDARNLHMEMLRMLCRSSGRASSPSSSNFLFVPHISGPSIAYLEIHNKTQF